MCYHVAATLEKNLINIPYGTELHLNRICDTDDKFNNRTQEYKNYLIARDYKPFSTITLF